MAHHPLTLLMQHDGSNSYELRLLATTHAEHVSIYCALSLYFYKCTDISMPLITRVPAKKQALPGPMRIALEGSMGAWWVYER